MALTVVASGTQSVAANVTDATSFAYTTTTSGLYVAKLDVAAWARANELEALLWDENFEAGSGNAEAYHNSFPKSDPIVYTPPFPATDFFGLQLISAASANVPWKVYTLGTPVASFSGTLALDGTLQTIVSGISSSGVYMLKLDLTTLANGDEVAVAANDRVLAGGTTRQSWSAYFANAQAYPVKHSPPIPSDVSLAFTIRQTAGVNRTIGYRVLRISS